MAAGSEKVVDIVLHLEAGKSSHCLVKGIRLVEKPYQECEDHFFRDFTNARREGDGSECV